MAHRSLLTDDQQLDRYLKTGTQGTFFLPGKNKMFPRRNVMSAMIESGRGKEAVDAVIRVNREKTYLKREPLLYFVAVAAASADAETKKAVYTCLNEICATPTDLFTFLKHLKELSNQGLTKGWGRALRRGVTLWYNTKDPMVLADLVTRYTQLGRWSHRDVFRMSHIKPANESLNFIVKVMTKGFEKAKKETESPSQELKPLIGYCMAVQLVKHTDDGVTAARLIEQHNLKIEHVPTVLLNSLEVWNTLISTMTISEVFEHLPTLARHTFLTIPVKGNPAVEVLKNLQSRVIAKIRDLAELEKDKLGPFVIYVAMCNYMRVFEDKKAKKDQSCQKKDQSCQTVPLPGHRGRGDIACEAGAEPAKKKKKKKKKKGKPEPEEDQLTKDLGLAASSKVLQNNPELWESLHAAFKHAMEKNLPCSNKRVLIAVKACTSAIGQGIRGMPSVTPLEVMALLAAFYKRAEKERELGFFTASFTPMKYSSEVQELIREIGHNAAPVPNLNCDPAAPVTWALEKRKKFDVFLVLSDGHEAKGEITPSEKLEEYRQAMGIPDAKMVICGLTSPKLDFADAAGMLDIGGFDPTVPTLIHRFIQGEL